MTWRFALAFRHLAAARSPANDRRGHPRGKRFLIIDLKRQKPLSFTLSSVLLLPPTYCCCHGRRCASSMHDGFYQRTTCLHSSALQTLARAADPGMQVEICLAPTRYSRHRSPLCSPVRAQLTESSECSADRQPGE